MRVICPKCETDKNICWNSDFTFEDCGMEGEGIASFYECLKCHTWIEIYVPEEGEDNDEQ